jgi:hypothetical protein
MAYNHPVLPFDAKERLQFVHGHNVSSSQTWDCCLNNTPANLFGFKWDQETKNFLYYAKCLMNFYIFHDEIRKICRLHENTETCYLI